MGRMDLSAEDAESAEDAKGLFHHRDTKGAKGCNCILATDGWG